MLDLVAWCVNGIAVMVSVMVSLFRLARELDGRRSCQADKCLS